MGALLGLVSVGALPIWLLLFPPTMAGVIEVAATRGWFRPADPYQRRGSFRSLYVAPLSVILVVWPTVYLPLIVFSAILWPVVFLYVHLMGGAHLSQRKQDDLGLILVAVVILVLWTLLYCGMQARALKRFTGQWHRSLFIQLWLWTCVLFGVGGLVISRVHYSHSPGVPFEPLWPVILGWILAIFILSRLGVIFGLWLAPEEMPSGG
jgi:hypothetical protein